MSKNIDINNEEEILKECDFDYFYNSENCSRELCAFYNDIFRNENNENFDKRQALIDLGRIGIVLNNQSQQIAELKTENEKLQQQLKDNTKQVCEKIREWVVEHTLDFWTCENDDLDAELYEFLDQIEKGE